MRSKTEERRQVILEAATQAFQEIGYEHCSMSEITARAGGSKATVYNYFASKAELFAAVMLRAAGDISHAYEALTPGEDVSSALRVFGRRLLPLVLAEPVVSTLRMALKEAARSEVGRVFYEAGPKVGWIRMADFLDDAMARGQLRRADAWVASMHLRSLLEAEHFMQRLLGVCEPPTKKQVEVAVDRALDVFMAAYGVAAPR